MEKNIKDQNLSKIASKNSVYSLSSIFISKIGGLIFTIIIARFLLPELFGIYSLVLSVVSIVINFTDLGIDSSSVKYVAGALGKNNKRKARSYFRYFLKIKLSLILLMVIVILAISKYLSYNVFDKPLLFFPLIFACLYILMESLRSLFASMFTATKNLKPTPFLELIIQTSKILFSLFAILLLTDKFKVSGIFIAFAFSGFLFLVAEIIILVGKYRELFFGKLGNINKLQVLKYTGFIGLTNLSLIFFVSVDTLLLGRFVNASYLGYYRAALSLILTLSALLSISGVLLPIFTQIEKKRLERGFQRTLRYILIFSVPVFFGLIFISKYLIRAIYGLEYLPAVFPLYALSLLVIVSPLVSLYSTLFTAKEKAKDLAKLILFSLFINILLNFVLIKSFLKISQEYATVGAGIATLISMCFLLIFLYFKTKNKFKISVIDFSYYKILLASLIMSFFLFLFNSFVDMNLFFGIIDILCAAIVYFGCLILMKGVNKDDWNLIKNIFKRN
jgi:O-antigen/teichoic acid export membrane protein